MKNYILILLCVSMLFSCDTPNPNKPFDPTGGDSTKIIKDLQTFDVRDIFEGHPYFWPYFPHEETIPLDTLKNTNLMVATIYTDTIGWGLTHFSHKLYSMFWMQPVFRPTGSPLRAISFANDRLPFQFSTGRFSRTTNGMLEFSSWGGAPALYLRTISSKSTYSGMAITNRITSIHWNNTYTDTEERDINDFGFELYYRAPDVIDIDFFREEIGKNIYFGGDPAAIGNDLVNFPSKMPPPILKQEVYAPAHLLVQPEGKQPNDTVHNKREPLTIGWQGDPQRPGDTVLIMVTNHTSSRLTYPHYLRGHPMARYHPESHIRGLAVCSFDRSKPREIGAGYTFARVQDNVLPGTVPITWYKYIQEQSGKNTFTIPADVFANAVEGECYDIRCFRWNDAITYVAPLAYSRESQGVKLDRVWLLGPGNKQRTQVRSHARVVSMSVGRIILR